MRQSGDQWIEELDGKKHMLKAVPSVDIGACTACDFEGQESKCAGFPNSVCGSNSNSFIIKDLGILNEDGCLPEERTGKYPTIKDRNEYEGWRLFHIWDCIVCEKIGNDDEAIEIRVSALTRQEAIDRWNRRA